MFEVNNKDTRTTPTYFTPCSSVSIVNFEHVISGWDGWEKFKICGIHVTGICICQRNIYNAPNAKHSPRFFSSLPGRGMLLIPQVIKNGPTKRIFWKKFL